MTYTIYRPNSSGEIMAAFRPQKRFAELVRDDKLPAERDCSVYLKGVIERMTGTRTGICAKGFTHCCCTTKLDSCREAISSFCARMTGEYPVCITASLTAGGG